MNIPEQPNPPQEELLERALRYASEQRAYGDDDRRDETHEQCAARWYLTARPDPAVPLETALRALCDSEGWYQTCLDIARIGWSSVGDRWKVTDQGRRYLLQDRWAASPTVAEAEQPPQRTRWVTRGAVSYAVAVPRPAGENEW